MGERKDMLKMADNVLPFQDPDSTPDSHGARMQLMDGAWRDKTIVDRAAATGEGGFLVCVNLQNFKALNVLVGHDEGDRILERVQCYLGDNAVECWRTGGDEFVILLENGFQGATERMRSFSWLYQITVGATEGWRFEYGGESSKAVYPWRTMQAVMTPRCGLATVGEDPEEALGLARQRCHDHAAAAYQAGWLALTAGTWAGFAPLSRGFSNEQRIAARACPQCGANNVDILDQDLGWNREKCKECELEYDRNDVLIVRGEQIEGGYA